MRTVVLLFVILISMPLATAKQQCKVLVVYDGWVQEDYKNSNVWKEFRNCLKKSCSLGFAKSVNESALKNYDVLFILAPDEDVPDDEVNATVNWVEGGGILVIAGGNYANEITERFGMRFDGKSGMKIRNFVSHPITGGLKKIVGAKGSSKIEVFGRSIALGFDGSNNCFLAINESAGCGRVIAIGDNSIWSSIGIDRCDNEKLLKNIVHYCCCRRCSVPEFSMCGFLLSLGLILLCKRLVSR